MKTLPFFFILLLSLQSNAVVLMCEGRSSLELVFKSEVEVSLGEKVPVSNLNHLDVYLSSHENKMFELEIYDSMAPARHYASARMTKHGDELSWALWSRDYLLDVSCVLPK